MGTAINWEANRQGQVLAYDGSSLGTASTGLHLNSITSGGWTEVVTLSNASHTTLNDLACSDSGGSDPYATCLALTNTLTAFSGSNIGMQSYALGILDTTVPGTGNAPANLVTNLLLSTSHANSYSVIHAGAALSLGNVKSTESNMENNFGLLPTWQQACAASTGCTATSTTTTLTGPLIIDGGPLSATGFNINGNQNQLVVGSGTAILSANNATRGVAYAAPFNDQQGTYQSVTGSVMGTVAMPAGTRRLQFNVTSFTGLITIALPPTPNAGDTACASTTIVPAPPVAFVDAADIGTDVHGLTGSLSAYATACALWTGTEWDNV